MRALLIAAFIASPVFAGETAMTRHAKGEFTVKMTPVTDDAGLGRMTLEKTFNGPLAATGKGEMLTAMGADGGAAYVAAERVSGTLDGRVGTFMLVHRGVMTKESRDILVTIAPGTGTAALTGITGTLAIDIRDGKHFYDLAYTLPE
jgi:Protein of unknown function (DUF3224)